MTSIESLLLDIETVLTQELQKPRPSIGHLLKMRNLLMNSANSSNSGDFSGVTSLTLTNITSHTVSHSKNYNPFVRVVDNSGKEVLGFGLTFPTPNSFVVSFNPAFTGTLLYI